MGFHPRLWSSPVRARLIDVRLEPPRCPERAAGVVLDPGGARAGDGSGRTFVGILDGGARAAAPPAMEPRPPAHPTLVGRLAPAARHALPALAGDLGPVPP